MDIQKQKQINAFNACVASLQGFTELILSSSPVSYTTAQFEFTVYEALGYLSDAQKLLKNPDGFASPSALSSGVVGQGTSL